jgi:hypothetical protein
MRLLARMTVILALSAAACGKPSGSSDEGTSGSTTSGSQSSSSKDEPIDPATVGSISGVVRLEGWLKPDPDVKPGVPYCAALHPTGLKGETLVLGEGQAMANVFVHVKSGLGRRKFPVPDKPAILDQGRCVYSPHVIGLMANQPLLVRNSDDTMHNVHGLPRLSAEFNRGQASKGQEDTFRLPIPELSIVVKCDVHPWMLAWVHVVGHPFFQVTGKDGAYSLDGLPPGDYEIEARHERFPNASLVMQIKLGPKENVKQDFTFKGGKKPN